MVFNVLNFGAVGDGRVNDGPAIQEALLSCKAHGGGKVVFPPNHTFLASPFDLVSNLELYVGINTTILAHPDESYYHRSAFRDNFKEGSIWIGGKNLQNIRITGEGEINGNGIAFMGKELRDAFELKPFESIDPRPHLLVLENCKDIKIQHVTFKDAAYWGLHFIGCNGVEVSDLEIRNNLKIRNSDGIDFNHTSNAVVKNCLIESGDDCICFKNRREYSDYGICSNITVSNCELVSTSCGIKLGSENISEISDIWIEYCTIRKSNRGLGIQNRDEGIVKNVVFRYIIIEGRLFEDVWWGKSEPIYVTAYPRPPEKSKDGSLRFPEGKTQGSVGEVSDILFENIQCDSENGVFVGSSSPQKMNRIRFKKVTLKVSQKTHFGNLKYDLRPCEEGDFLDVGLYGFYSHRAEDVSYENCTVSIDPGCTRPLIGPYGRGA